MSRAPWNRSFEVRGAAGEGKVALAQRSATEFSLGSTIRYVGALTGLEGKVRQTTLDEIRVVSPETLPNTDLASVPAALQWFVNRYGLHTPAALVHDGLIGSASRPADLTDAYADRFFRFMLEDLGVPWIRRWMMWAATALRSRFARGGLSKLCIATWVIASTLGIASFCYGLAVLDGRLVLATLGGPFLFALLWGRQYGAGLVAAYTAPWVLPPTLFGALGYWIYRLLESIVARVEPGRDRKNE